MNKRKFAVNSGNNLCNLFRFGGPGQRGTVAGTVHGAGPEGDTLPQSLVSSARSSGLLSGATPVQDQPDPNESHGTCYNLGKKNRTARGPFRRDSGDHHGSQSDRESQQAGNPYSWFPARHQYDLIATLAIGPVSEFDGRGVHIEEWNEVQNNRHR